MNWIKLYTEKDTRIPLQPFSARSSSAKVSYRIPTRAIIKCSLVLYGPGFSQILHFPPIIFSTRPDFLKTAWNLVILWLKHACYIEISAKLEQQSSTEGRTCCSYISSSSEFGILSLRSLLSGLLTWIFRASNNLCSRTTSSSLQPCWIICWSV